MSKIIVTGGAGFIGSHLVDALIERGEEVHIVDNLSTGKKENINKKAIFHEIDIRNKEKLTEIFRGVKCVFHEAAMARVQFSIENPIETNDINVNGLLNVLEAARANNTEKVIFASSSSIYGNQEKLPLTETMSASPLSPYAAHKYIGEIYCKLYSQIYNLKTVCLRYFNVYGPRLDPSGAYPLVIGYFMERLKQGKTLTITGNGKQTRDFTHVEDVVRANILAMDSQKVGHGEVINIGTSKNYSINEVTRLIGGEIEYIAPRIEPHDTKADINLAQKLLDWVPEISLEEGLEELKNIYKK